MYACFEPGLQTVEGNLTLFANRTSGASCGYNGVSDGAKLFDPKQPRMVLEGAGQ